MTQDVVTARDVAAPAEVALPFLDARRICEMLDDALAHHSFHRTAYSEPTRSLFQLAWAVASHKQSTQVTVYHLAYALVCGRPEIGKALAECLKSDTGSLAVGCILRILTRGVSTGDADIVPPAVDAVRWLGNGMTLALRRGRQNELQPEDLVRAVQDGIIPGSVRAQLRAAARLGTVRGDIVLGTKQLPAPSSPHEVVQHIELIEKRKTETSGADIASVLKLLEDFEQRLSEDIDDQKQILDRIEAALPRPPSAARVTVAIVTVLILGAVAGLGLTL